MSAIVGHLGSFGDAGAPTNQPPDSGKIENAYPKPIAHPVMGRAVPSRPVDDVDIAHVVPIPAHQRRQEPMQAVEIRQVQENVAPECLEAATGVAGAVAQDRAANAVGHTGLELLGTGGLASDTLARNQADASGCLFERA